MSWFFIGGGGIGIPNFNFPASWQTEYRKTEMPSTQEIIDKTTQFWHQYQAYILIGHGIHICRFLGIDDTLRADRAGNYRK